MRTNNLERARITSIGNFGIGTTNPLGKLHINNDLNGADSSFIVTNAGRVGINTANPTANGLTVKMRSGFSQPFMNVVDDLEVPRVALALEGNSSTSFTNLRFDLFPLNSTSQVEFRFLRSTNTTGPKEINFYRGNNTASVSARIAVDGGNSFFQGHGGNFGIGTFSPLTKFHVNNDMAGSDSSFVITSGGEVGIGTNNPSGPLNIHRSGVSSIITMETWRNGGNQNKINAFGSRGSELSPLWIAQNDYLMEINAYGYNGNPNLDSNRSSRILMAVDGPVTANNVPGSIIFLTRGAVGDAIPRMIIKNNGNVGIGTLNAARPLHVNDVMRLNPRATAPTSPAKGDMYFDGILNKLRVYDGTTWQNCW